LHYSTGNITSLYLSAYYTFETNCKTCKNSSKIFLYATELQVFPTFYGVDQIDLVFAVREILS